MQQQQHSKLLAQFVFKMFAFPFSQFDFLHITASSSFIDDPLGLLANLI